MKLPACFAAVDVGAESGRVMKGLWDGHVMRLEETYRFANGGVSLDGTLRWDIVKIWAEVLRGVSALRDVSKGELMSIGVDTWAIDYVLLSRTNEIVVQPYHYRDRRTRGLVNATFERISRQELYGANGLQFMELNTIYQLIAAQRDHPELLQVATTLLMIPDFLHWCLSGERAAEFTNATTTGFLNPRSGTWALDLLKRLGLPIHLMPRLVMPGTILGPLRDEVAQDSGLGKVSVVAPATHDTASAVAAVPTESTGMPGWAYISSGTWSLVGIEASAPILSERACQMSVTNEGGVDGTWRVLKNVMGLWLLQRCRVALAARAGSYSELVALAEAAAPGIAFIDPDDDSFINPPDMPRAIQEYCRASGQPVPESIGAIVRCVLESLALKYRAVLHSLEELTGTPCRVLHIVGGGSRNDLLNELTASACNCEVIAGPVEATALGNVLLQARARGEIASLAEMRAVVRASSELRHFLPRAHDWWAAAAARFQSLLN